MSEIGCTTLVIRHLPRQGGAVMFRPSCSPVHAPAVGTREPARKPIGMHNEQAVIHHH